jgi:hypothetical protein
MPTIEKQHIFCNHCHGNTNHLLRGQYVHKWASPPDDGIQGAVEYSLWICAGCDTGVLEIKESNSEDYIDEDTPNYQIEYFPKRMGEALAPKHFRKLSSTLSKIYSETIECFNSSSLILSTAGLRALIEGVCEDKRIAGRSLKTKIDNLRTLLPNNNIIAALHRFRFIGNEAVHNLKAPKLEDVKLAINVMEDLLNFLYELDYKALRVTNAHGSSDDE